ncbi:MAG: hypothetical protein WC789_10115 [Lentisphaeria bacterium]|jgi:hypothetical protein
MLMRNILAGTVLLAAIGGGARAAEPPAAAAGAAEAEAEAAATPAPELPSPAALAAERSRIQELVNQKVSQLVEESVRPPKVAAGLKLDWPVRPPRLTPEQVKAKAEAELAAKLEAALPATRLEERKKEAETKLQPHRVGDPIAFNRKNYRGPVSGVLRAVELPVRIRVGDQYVATLDIPDEVLVRLDPARREKALKAEAARLERLWTSERFMFTQKHGPEILKRVFEESGYRWVAPMASRAKRWLSGEEIFQAELPRQREAAAARLRPAVEQEIFARHGYEQFQGEWLPKAVAAARRAAQAEAEQARGAAPPPVP